MPISVPPGGNGPKSLPAELAKIQAQTEPANSGVATANAAEEKMNDPFAVESD